MGDEVIRARFTAVVLAGGRARRMGGVDKTRLAVGDRSMFRCVVDAVEPLVAEIVVACGDPARAADFGPWRTAADLRPDLGPLAGIRAGLGASRTPWIFAVAADMPLLDTAFVRRILAAAGDPWRAVVPRRGDKREPLHAAYHTALIPLVDRHLAAGHLQPASLYGEVPTLWIEASDDEARSFANVNRPEDLAVLNRARS